LKSVSVSRSEGKPSGVLPPGLSARAPGAAPMLVEINGSWYASLAEAEKQCRLILTNAQKMQVKGSYLENLIYDLANVLYRQNKFAQAEPLYREMLRRSQSRLSPQHDGVLANAIRLGRVLSELAWVERATNVSAAYEHAREGEELLRGALEVRLNKNYGFSEIADTQSRLGGALVVFAFIDPALTSTTRELMLIKAEALLRQGHTEDMKAKPEHKRDGLERLVRLYEAWEKPEKLAEWKQKLDAFDKGAGAGAKSE
jgi:tetratricopeptide (TPR) repeat protein